MLRYRLVSAAIIVSMSLVFVALDACNFLIPVRGFWMLPLGIYLFLGSAWECSWMVSRSRYGAITAPALIGCGGVMVASIVRVFWPLSGQPYPQDCLLGELGWPLAAAAIALVGCFGWFLRQYRADSDLFLRAILSGWVAVYFGICFSFAIALRMTGENRWGLYLLVGIIVATKFADAGAYFVGRSVGKTKLCPSVSPGKTVEGLIGGAVVSVIAAWVYFQVCAPWIFGGEAVRVRLVGVVALGVLLTVAGVLGDLLASVFKRETGQKDSGRLLPGLGGIWDITDSLLPAMVVGYLVVVAELIVGPGQ